MKKLLLTTLAMAVMSSTTIAKECSTSKTIDVAQWHQGTGYSISTDLYLTNVSSEDVEISLSYVLQDGSNYTEETQSGTQFHVYGAFSEHPAIASATLSPGKSGKVRLAGSSNFDTEYFGYIKLTWEAESCLSNPLRGTVGHSSRVGMNYTEVNSGNAF